MLEITINWGNGQMKLNAENVFPCNLGRAKRLCHLINQYSSDEDKDKLRAYLLKQEKVLREKVENSDHKKTDETKLHKCLRIIEFLDNQKQVRK